MVARVEIAVVLEGQGGAALFREHTETRAKAQPVSERDIKELNEDSADIALHPFIKNSAQELAVLRGLDAPLRHGRFGGATARRRWHREVQVDRPGSGVCFPFHERNELDESGADLL